MVTVPWTILFAVNYEFEQRMFLFLVRFINLIEQSNNQVEILEPPREEVPHTLHVDNEFLFNFQTTTANFSLFPLLFREEETLVKVVLHLFYITCCMYYSLNSSTFGVNTVSKAFTGHRKTMKFQYANTIDSKHISNMSIAHILEYIYLSCAIFVFAFPYVMSSFMDADQVKKFVFLPLLNYSVYSACGNCYVFVRYYWTYLVA